MTGRRADNNDNTKDNAKHTRAGWILLAVTVVIVAAIFTHSLMPAEASAEESGSLVELAARLAAFFHLPMLLDDHIIRKMAHFIEFAVYGFFLAWTVRERDGSIRGNIYKILFLLLLIPLCDETLQYFSPGRSAEVRDILLDFSGAVTGALIRWGTGRKLGVRNGARA